LADLLVVQVVTLQTLQVAAVGLVRQVVIVHQVLAVQAVTEQTFRLLLQERLRFVQAVVVVGVHLAAVLLVLAVLVQAGQQRELRLQRTQAQVAVVV
jgi:hypothetical protein